MSWLIYVNTPIYDYIEFKQESEHLFLIEHRFKFKKRSYLVGLNIVETLPAYTENLVV